MSLIPRKQGRKLTGPQMVVFAASHVLVLMLHLPGSSVAPQVAKLLPPQPQVPEVGASWGQDHLEHLTPALPGVLVLTALLQSLE